MADVRLIIDKSINFDKIVSSETKFWFGREYINLFMDDGSKVGLSDEETQKYKAILRRDGSKDR